MIRRLQADLIRLAHEAAKEEIASDLDRGKVA
jgi:hypothetical protein